MSNDAAIPAKYYHQGGPANLPLWRIAAGDYPGLSVIHGAGERESMGTTASGEDIWAGNELTPAPTSTTTIPTPPDVGEQMTLVSESIQDTTGGSGIAQVMVHYLDADGNEQTETVALDGTTPVDTVATDIRFVQDLHAIAPPGQTAAGHVKIYAKSDSGLVYSMIKAGGTQSNVPHRMVPANYRLHLVHWCATEAKGKRVSMRLMGTSKHGTLYEGVFLEKGISYLAQMASPIIPVGEVLPEFSIVKLRGWPDATAGAEASGSWCGILEYIG